jgi:hypothetical protein
MAPAAARYPQAGVYLRAAQRAFARTAQGGTIRLFWSDAGYDAAGWRREFLAALDRRINAKGALPVATARWRKLDADWQRGTWQFSRRVNTPRLIVRVREAPAEWRAKLAHRLTRPDEE